MKRLLVAALTVAVLSIPTPVEAHTMRCAAYVGNPCYQHAAWHGWWHEILSLGFLR